MATLSKKVFIDASIFFSFINRAHGKHTQAAAFFRYFGQEQYRLYTDYLNIDIAHKQIHFQISPSLSRDFLRTIFFSNINIIYPEETDIKATLKTLLNYQSIDLTFEKALMATLANRKEIPQVCTFDPLPRLFGLSLFYLPI